MNNEIPFSQRQALHSFERHLRISLMYISLTNLKARRCYAVKRVAELSPRHEKPDVHSSEWLTFRTWQIRLAVYDEIWEIVAARDRAIKTMPKHIVEFEKFLRGKLEGISYNNLLLRKKTADFFVKRLSNWKYFYGYPGWVELQEWKIRMKVYKQLIKKFNA